MDLEELITTVEAGKKLGISARTVCRFCDSGFIPHVKRNRKYQRILNPAQFELLAILVKMKASGFSKSEIKRYAKLSRQGKVTAKERLALLTTKKHQLQQEIKDRQSAIDFIERQEEITALNAEKGY